MSPGTDLTVPQEVELVDAVVHALHVLEDVGPRVWRGTQGGHVARLHTHTPRHSTAIIGAIRPSCMQRVAPHSLHERPSRVCRSRQGKKNHACDDAPAAWGCPRNQGTGHRSCVRCGPPHRIPACSGRGIVSIASAGALFCSPLCPPVGALPLHAPRREHSTTHHAAPCPRLI